MLDRQNRVMHSLQRRFFLNQAPPGAESKLAAPRGQPGHLRSPSDFQPKPRRRELLRRVLSPPRQTQKSPTLQNKLLDSPKQQAAQTQVEQGDAEQWGTLLFHTLGF